MYMAYTSNPQLPQVRMEAVRLVESGWSIRKVARHLGFSHCTVRLWLEKKPEYGHYGRFVIPTRSSRPHAHPRQLDITVVQRILELRAERDQCAEILHHRLVQEGITVSLSSVKRVLKRHGISRFSRWKKWHQYPPRPLPEKPGILVQIDTIHDGPHADRLYIYTLLDVHSRWAHAAASARITTHRSLGFVKKAQIILPFSIQTLQSDHGPEFSKYFTKQIEARGLSHRHSRVRTPNDNAHLERFNRTIQDQCLSRIPRTLRSYQKEIPEYLRYYNYERPHMGLSMKTPIQLVTSY
jgi:transposase InsO family protein